MFVLYHSITEWFAKINGYGIFNDIMATNVEIKKGAKDNNVNLIKKFTRRVQEAGIIPRVKGLRYAERNMSAYVKKTKRLKSIKNREVREEQIKLGKIAVNTRRGR